MPVNTVHEGMAKAEEYQFDFKPIYESLDPLIDSGIQYYTDKDGDYDYD